MKTAVNKTFEEIKKLFYKASEKITMMLPDWVTGDSTVMRQKYRKQYGWKDSEGLIKQKKIKITMSYLLLTVCFILLVIGTAVSQITEGGELFTVKRPEYGTGAASIPVEVRMDYNGYSLTKKVALKVSEKALTEKEKQKYLSYFRKRLGVLILGENKDLQHISKPMELIDRDKETGITVAWTSDHPEIIDEKGFVDLLEAKDHQQINLKAELTLDDITENHTFIVRMDTSVPKADYSSSLEYRLNTILEQLSEKGSSVDLKLPNKIEGLQISWSAQSENNLILFFFSFLFSGLIIYFKRYDQINKELKEAEESIISDLPEFINKLVLLLNAGLVVSTAFSKIVEDYEVFYSSVSKSTGRRRYLYEELREIQNRTNRTNTSMIFELKEFSQRSGVRELIRLTAIIADNWNKGSMLAEKLEGESELLWVSRKKRAEEKGKIAETKLTFPLMILLIVLIMITIAPALMEM